MEKVTGIGGIFFKARDPALMPAWYRDHLGVLNEDGCGEFVWREHDQPNEVGRTVWSLFPANTDYFGPASTRFMINYRVANLNAMIEQLKEAGIAVDKVVDYDYGRFACLTDPEGNRIELWEPKTTASKP